MVQKKLQMGKTMYQLMEKLYPICRSITGNGTRKTLKIISDCIPLTIHEVPTGTNVFDWTIPKEWNIKDAYIKAPNSKKIIKLYFLSSELLILTMGLEFL
jgi:aminopeptidase-like protein